MPLTNTDDTGEYFAVDAKLSSRPVPLTRSVGDERGEVLPLPDVVTLMMKGVQGGIGGRFAPLPSVARSI